MKKLLLSLLLILLFSCTTTETTPAKEERILIYQVDQFKQSDVEFMDEYFEEVYITHHIDQKETHITYRFNNHHVYNFEQTWKLESKRIRLDNLYVVYKLKYKIKNGELKLNSVVYDVVLEGINTGEIRKQINRQVYTERAGESSGVIQLIIGIWNPSILDTIPFPKLENGDKFSISSLGEERYRLSNDSTTFNVTNKGEHFWLGY